LRSLISIRFFADLLLAIELLVLVKYLNNCFPNLGFRRLFIN